MVLDYIYDRRERLVYATITIEKIAQLEEIKNNKASFKKLTNKIFYKYGFEWLIPIQIKQKQFANLAFYGHLKLLQLIHAKNPNLKLHIGICIAAAKNDHINIIKWASANGVKIKSSKICVEFAKNKNLEAIIEMRKLGCNFDEDICNCTALTNDYDLLQDLIKIGCPLRYGFIDIAAKNGHLKLIQFAFAIGFTPVSYVAFENALVYKHYDVFIWMCENDCRTTRRFPMDLLFKTLAKRNELTTLKWAHEFFPQHNKTNRVVHEAYKKKHFELLVWAIENMIPKRWNISNWHCFQDEAFLKIYFEKKIFQ